MFTAFRFVPALVLAATVAACAAPRLEQMPSGRYALPGVAVGRAFYFPGGSTATGFSSDIIKVDDLTGAVKALRASLLPRRYHSAQSDGHFLYIFGGVATIDTPRSMTTVVERYDLESGQTVKMAPMPAGLRAPASAMIGRQIHVIGGSDATGARVGTHYIYDIPSNTWKNAAPLPLGRECAVAARAELIYAIGGYDGHFALRNCDVYNARTDRWRPMAQLPVKTSAHHVAVVGDSLFSFGDYDQLNRVLRFDFSTQKWQSLSNTGFIPRRHAAVIASGTQIAVAGGVSASSGSFLSSVQLFDAHSLGAR